MLTPEYLVKISDSIAKVRQQRSDAFTDCAAIIEQSVWDSRDKIIHRHMAGVADKLAKDGHTDNLHKNLLYPAIRGLEILASSARDDGRHFRTLLDFCRFFNTEQGGPFNALLNPYFAELYMMVYPTRKCAGYNIYSVGPERLFAAGNVNQSLYDVDLALSAGFARITINCHKCLSSGAGNVTICGLAHRGENIVDARWTGSQILIENDNVFTIDPDVKGDLCVKVNSVILPGGFQSGDIDICGHGPLGRL